MAYIGNSLTQQSFTGGMDQFNGNASNTTFGLSRNITTPFDINVYVEGVFQRPGVSYTVSANTITFESAPSSGANNIVVVYENFTATSIVPIPGSVTPSSIAANTIQATLGYVPANKAGETFTGPVTFANSSANVISMVANGSVGVGTGSGAYKLSIQSNNANILSVTTTGSFARPIISTQSTSGDPETSLQFADGASRNYYMGIYYPAASYKRFYFDNRTGLDTSFEVDGVSKLSISNTGVVYVNSGQLKFPATQVASSDSNTLDDYEEGTWTPTFVFATPGSGATYTTQLGWYTKIGNIVICQALVQLSNKGTGAGITFVGGLPFSTPATALYSGGAVGYVGGFSANAPATCYADPSATRIVLFNPVTSSYTDYAALTNTTLLSVQITYRAA